MTNPYLCLFMISLLSPLGLLEEIILPSSNTGPEDDWLPGSNPWVFDSASNPILRPPDLLEWILGDPAVVQLGGKIHMFANEVFCVFKIGWNIWKGVPRYPTLHSPPWLTDQFHEAWYGIYCSMGVTNRLRYHDINIGILGDCLSGFCATFSSIGWCARLLHHTVSLSSS